MKGTPLTTQQEPATPMGKTDTRQRIILAAAMLIHQKGYGGTTIDDVLVESGVKKGNLYYYFASKEELGLAVVDFMHESHLQSLQSFLANGDLSPRERISQWLMSMAGKMADTNCTCGCPFGNLALELSDSNELFRQRILNHFAEWEQLLADCVREGQAAGEFDPDMNAADFAASALAQLEGAILMAKLTREIRPLELAMTELRRRLDAVATHEVA